jgi:hypothetical protein
MHSATLAVAAIAVSFAVADKALAGPQYVNLLTNGNFDTPPGGSTVSTQFGSDGYAAMPGWTVSAVNGSTPFDLWWVAATASSASARTQYGNSGQELVSSFPGADGANPYFVSLDGDSNSSGTLAQTVAGLTIGDHYQLSFDWAATQMTTASHNPYTIGVAFNLGGAALTGITGAPTTSVYSGAYGSSSAWSTVTFDFTASSASEILSFLAYGTPVGGPPVALLDNVSLEDIPEPSGIAAVGIAAMLGVVTWRRRTRRSI